MTVKVKNVELKKYATDFRRFVKRKTSTILLGSNDIILCRDRQNRCRTAFRALARQVFLHMMTQNITPTIIGIINIYWTSFRQIALAGQ